MEGILVAHGIVTWRDITRESIRLNIPVEQVLAEIARAGYAGAPADADARAGRSAEETVEFYARYGLKPAPDYLGAAFWKQDQRKSILKQAQELARFTRELGCAELFIIAEGFDYITARGQTRAAIAGRVGPEDALTTDEYKRFADVLNEVGEITLKEGVRSCFHNHVGSVIETREEIDHLFSLVDRDLVFQGPDIGHLALAGVDVVQFCRDYAGSIKTMHLKDMHHDIMRKGLEEEWDFWTFYERRVWAELGEGCVDFPTIFEILLDAGFNGWVIVETDVTGKPSALESAIISRNYLKSIGI